jgi:PTH1 family peptidyl-tRNA hydrolase
MVGTPNWLIVGLGNPGRSYEKTRHNLGFMLIDELAREAETQIKREECRSLVGRTVIENTTVELAKPQTFMNLSGEAVKCLILKPDRSTERLVVISDDLALPLGTIRLRPKGTHGGHNGLRSIIDVLGTNEFTRLRIGIMPEHPVMNAKGFVLENFAMSEFETVERILANSADAVRTVITDGIDVAMAKWN